MLVVRQSHPFCAGHEKQQCHPASVGPTSWLPVGPLVWGCPCADWEPVGAQGEPCPKLQRGPVFPLAPPHACPCPKSFSVSQPVCRLLCQHICLRSLRVLGGWKGVPFASASLSLSLLPAFMEAWLIGKGGTTGIAGEKPLRK